MDSIFFFFLAASLISASSLWVKPPRCPVWLLLGKVLASVKRTEEGPVSSCACHPQEAARLVMKLLAGAGCGLEARETRVCGWDLGSSAL